MVEWLPRGTSLYGRPKVARHKAVRKWSIGLRNMLVNQKLMYTRGLTLPLSTVLGCWPVLRLRSWQLGLLNLKVRCSHATWQKLLRRSENTDSVVSCKPGHLAGDMLAPMPHLPPHAGSCHFFSHFILTWHESELGPLPMALAVQADAPS